MSDEYRHGGKNIGQCNGSVDLIAHFRIWSKAEIQGDLLIK
jgi:hypothetical protein